MIGLGSNEKDRLLNLRLALNAIRKEKKIVVVSTSPIYISKALPIPGSPNDWDRDCFNAAIKINTTLSPESLLKVLKKIETKLGSSTDHEKRSPRVIDLDILSWEDQIYDSATLAIPHSSLLQRSFALRPLLDVDPLWVHPCHPQRDFHLLFEKLDELLVAPYSLEGTKIMGVINLTPISMSGENQKLSAEELREKIVKMINDGAEIIDIGAESTRPNAEPISPSEEWERLQPLLKNIPAIYSDPSLLMRPAISIDTYHSETVFKLKDHAIDIINDVYGFEKEKIASYLKGTQIRYVLVHNMGKSGIAHMDDNTDITEQIINWFCEEIDLLLKIGLRKDQIILDPGIGFGKTSEQTAIILKEIDKIKKLGYPIVVGHSRKASAMPDAKHLPPQQRDLETAFISKYLSKKKIDFIRVHNCRLNRQLIDLTISIIVAQQSDRGIGYKNQLPWSLKNDQENFKQLTLNKVVLMGRKTYESIGHPLKKRENIVISSQLSKENPESQALLDKNDANLKIASGLSAALLEINPLKEVFIIGGENIYRECLKFSDRIYLTIVQASEPVDTFFPEINLNHWNAKELFKVSADEYNQFPYEVKQLNRVWE